MGFECVKTGCEAYLPEYGEWVRGDAFVATPRTSGQGILIVRVCARSPSPFSGRRHFTVYRVEQWFDERRDLSLGNSTIVSAYYENHGYDGVSDS